MIPKRRKDFLKKEVLTFQFVDILDKGLSKGELRSVIAGVGGLEKVLDEKAKDYSLISYLVEEQKQDKLLETPSLYKTPIVRNGKKATIGYQPEIWKEWLKA